MRALYAAVFILVTALASLGGWAWFNRPVPVELSYDEPFPSVSFAPFRRGQSPLTRTYAPPEQIEEDLASVVGIARGIRTYTALEGLEIVPDLARKYGLELTHSAWLGVKRDTNDREVAALIHAANTHTDVIKRVIVGNEVLLRNDLSVDQLIRYIRKVRSSVEQPVSYADVWAFWLKNPQLAAEVDYITIHILPYWEDEPVGVKDAARHIEMIYDIVHKAFPDKPILIGESGWPTRGRNRGPAAVNVENAAYFVRTLAQVAKKNGFDYNLVEAFDQPWKAALEGSVGARWGVMDEMRRVKYRMSGPVEANPDWRVHAGGATLLGALAALWFLRRPERYAPRGAFAVAALAQVIATLTVWQGLNALWLGYDWGSDIWAFVRVGIHAAFAAILMRVAGQALAENAPAQPSRWAERLAVFYALAAIVASALIFFAGRYRDIPNLEFLVPCVGLAAFALARMAVLGHGWRRAFAIGRMFSAGASGGFGPARAVMIALVVSAVAAPVSEAVALYRGDDFQAMHPDLSQQIPLLLEIMAANTEMLVWSAMLLVMALPFLAEWRLGEKKGG